MIMRKPLQTRENDRMLEPRSGYSEALNHTTGREVMMASSKLIRCKISA